MQIGAVDGQTCDALRGNANAGLAGAADTLLFFA
jgi:hypothetical protein